jgi:hypothetical protein
MSLLHGVSIEQLAQLIDDQISAGLQVPAGGGTTVQPTAQAGPEPWEGRLEHLSAQEVADLLAHLETAPGSGDEAR